MEMKYYVETSKKLNENSMMQGKENIIFKPEN